MTKEAMEEIGKSTGKVEEWDVGENGVACSMFIKTNT